MLNEDLSRRAARPVTGALWTLLACLLVAGVAVAVLRGGGTPGEGRAGDGRVGDARVTVEDTGHPAVAGLDPALREALRAATAAAASDGVEVLVTSGWRSREYQAELLADAVERYGSREEAARWVATPEASRHVRGEAVDVGPTDAAHWVAEHGARFGLCRVYANEVWHYELLTVAGGTCPPLRADAAG